MFPQNVDGIIIEPLHVVLNQRIFSISRPSISDNGWFFGITDTHQGIITIVGGKVMVTLLL